MLKTLFNTGLITALLLSQTTLLAATDINLRTQTNPFLTTEQFAAIDAAVLKEQKDLHGMTHLHLQQYYKGYPVYGAQFTAHLPSGWVIHNMQFLKNTHAKIRYNGVVYQHLSDDLTLAPALVFHFAQALQIERYILNYYQSQYPTPVDVSVRENTKAVYVAMDHKAHWVNVVRLDATHRGQRALPVFIVDAQTFQIYHAWDDKQALESVLAGGVGGNKKTGMHIFDGALHHFPAFSILRDSDLHTCFLQNQHVILKDRHVNNNIAAFHCDAPDVLHNNVYWNAMSDAANGAYSPINDAFYFGTVISDMFVKQYGLSVFESKGCSAPFTLNVHANKGGAYWDGIEVVLGDGGKKTYPSATLDLIAHEAGHAFTTSNAGLEYDGESAGVSESFSDMTAQAAHYFLSGKNTWQIGADSVKAKNKALRYMDLPLLDCGFEGKPGFNCSIDYFTDYYDGVDPHFSSGVFNKAYYLLSKSKSWNTQKVFDVLVHANRYYWTNRTTFHEAACNIVDAAKDYQYEADAIQGVMREVGIDLTSC